MIVVVGIMTTVSKLISILASVVGYPKTVQQMAGVDVREYYVGTEARAKRDVLELQYPIEHGIVTNWDSLEKLWQHTFVTELQRDPAECNVIFTEPPMNPKSNREKMVSMAFDTCNVQGTYIANSAALALYASGRTTGLVLNSGDGVTHTVPIHEDLLRTGPWED